MAVHRDLRLLVGGFTDGAADGPVAGLALHHVYADGRAEVEGVLKLENPTWIAQGALPGLFYVSHSARRMLTAVRIATDRSLELVDEVDIGALNPAHVVTASAGNHVIAACFTEGVIVRVGLASDGTFTGIEQTWEVGSAAPAATYRNRLQDEAEPHQAVAIEHGSYLVPDRAQDVIWRIDPSGEFEPVVTTRPGAGPRHLVLHSSSRFAYLVGELDSTLITLRREGRRLTPVDVQSGLPRDWFGDSAAAAISIDASRERIYFSNRGHDSVAVFGLQDPSRPELIGWVPARGKTPRFAGLLSEHDVYAIALQGSDRVDLLAGRAMAQLADERVSIKHAAPTCVVAVCS